MVNSLYYQAVFHLENTNINIFSHENTTFGVQLVICNIYAQLKVQHFFHIRTSLSNIDVE